MNQFRVQAGQEAGFEQAWRERESFLDGVDGFRSFALLRGPEPEEGPTLFTSHTVWRDEGAFRAWVDSDNFKKAHSQGGSLKEVLAGPPQLYLWTEVDLG